MHFQVTHFITFIFSIFLVAPSEGGRGYNRPRPGPGWRGQGGGGHVGGHGFGNNGNNGYGHNYNRGNGGYGQFARPTYVQQNLEMCAPPQFTDDASFEVDACAARNNRDQSCYSKRTQVQGKATMICQTGALTLRYTSTCSYDGEFSPRFPDNCAALFELEGYGTGNTQTSTPKSDCREFRVRLTENFSLTCQLPGAQNEEENCFANRKSVPSGTKMFLKCKPPYRSSTGHSPEWLCENGNWPTEVNKLMCMYTSMVANPDDPNSRYHPTTPTYQQTTSIPTHSPITTTSPYFPWNQNQITPESYTPIDPEEIPQPYPNYAVATIPPTTAPAPTRRPTPIPTSPTRRPTVIPTAPNTPVPTTSPSTIPPSFTEKMCPGLTHRSPGVKVECVFMGQEMSTSDCRTEMPKGSEAKYSCLDYHESTFGLKTLFRKCKEDGSWTGNMETFKCVPSCGRANVVRVPYITNGQPTIRGQWPWHAGIFLFVEKTEKWTFICGGTLITKKAILTAAHCVTLLQTTETRDEVNFRIDLGKYEREKLDDLVQVKGAAFIAVHPSYNPYGYDSDIAIIVLNSEIDVGYHVRPICFPQTSDSATEEIQLSENSVGTVVGWGFDENQNLASNLQMARLKVVGRRECSQAVSGGSSQIQTRSTTYCAGFQNGTNVCNGDSGGGMYFHSKESEDVTKWYLQGIVSVGIADESGRCDPAQYSVFTRVGRYSDWITRILTENDAI